MEIREIELNLNLRISPIAYDNVWVKQLKLAGLGSLVPESDMAALYFFNLISCHGDGRFI